MIGRRQGDEVTPPVPPSLGTLRPNAFQHWLERVFIVRGGFHQCLKKCEVCSILSSKLRGFRCEANCTKMRECTTHLGLLYHLWRGQVDEAIQILEDYRSETKRLDKLDELIAYLAARRPFIPHYKLRRQQRQFIGSGHAEKANDLLVARRQKHRGMHWSLETSDALASLKNLMLNGGWDLYWSDRQVLPLALPST